MWTGDMLFGAVGFLDRYLELTPEASLLLVAESQCLHLAAGLAVISESRGVKSTVVPMLTARDPGLKSRLTAAISTLRDQPLRIVVLELDTLSHGELLQQLGAELPMATTRIFRIMGATGELFKTTFRTLGPMDFSRRNTALLRYLASATRLTLETDSGTSLSVALDPTRYVWIDNRGVWSPGRLVVLPAGEVSTYPVRVEGTLVADFAAFVGGRIDMDLRLADCPVTVEINGGMLKRIQCSDVRVSRFLESLLSHDAANRVGELGFGTDDSITAPLAGNHQLNERRAGIHLGFGQHNQPDSRVAYTSKVHFDLIARGGRVRVDDTGHCIDMEQLDALALTGSAAQPGSASSVNGPLAGYTVGDMAVFSPDD